MENAAMAAYLKDVESNNVDLTAEKIMREKLNPVKTEPKENPNQMPAAAPETIPRFNKNRGYRDDTSDMDYCDPYARAKRNHQQAKFASQAVPTTSNNAENKSQGKSNKGGREKRKDKRPQGDESTGIPNPQKLWYEARTPEGYTYYWHIETNESVWEIPAEGYMSIAEQENEAREEALQAKFFEQIDNESAGERAKLMEEQRANAEREKLRELRKRNVGKRKKNDNAMNDASATIREIPEETRNESADEEQESEEKIPYRRDYSVPEKPEPYGPWQTVKVIHEKPVDLQLPKKKTPLAVPSLHSGTDSTSSKRIFTEKIVTRLTIGDSDDDNDETTPTTFKKRKLGMKNVRKRFDDD